MIKYYAISLPFLIYRSLMWSTTLGLTIMVSGILPHKILLWYSCSHQDLQNYNEPAIVTNIHKLNSNIVSVDRFTHFSVPLFLKGTLLVRYHSTTIPHVHLSFPPCSTNKHPRFCSPFSCYLLRAKFWLFLKRTSTLVGCTVTLFPIIIFCYLSTPK